MFTLACLNWIRTSSIIDIFHDTTYSLRKRPIYPQKFAHPPHCSSHRRTNRRARSGETCDSNIRIAIDYCL